MGPKQWMVVVPVLLVLGVGGPIVLHPVLTRGADNRIVDSTFLRLEQELGYHLYAPTWLPEGGRIGSVGTMQGQHRILQDFSDAEGQSLLFVAQEHRSAERDRYHDRIFVRRADAKADINGRQGYFVTGTSGERRLFWNEADVAVIVSSSVLGDEDLIRIAKKVK